MNEKAMKSIKRTAENEDVWLERVGEGDEVSAIIEGGMVKRTGPHHINHETREAASCRTTP